MKVQGPNVDGIQQLAAQIQNVLSSLPQVRSVFAETVSQGFYVNVEVEPGGGCTLRADQLPTCRRRLPPASAGKTSRRTSKAANAIPINVRYQRDFRDNIEEMRGVLIGDALGRADSARPSGRAFRSRAARR